MGLGTHGRELVKKTKNARPTTDVESIVLHMIMPCKRVLHQHHHSQVFCPPLGGIIFHLQIFFQIFWKFKTSKLVGFWSTKELYLKRKVSSSSIKSQLSTLLLKFKFKDWRCSVKRKMFGEFSKKLFRVKINFVSLSTTFLDIKKKVGNQQIESSFQKGHSIFTTS